MPKNILNKGRWAITAKSTLFFLLSFLIIHSVLISTKVLFAWLIGIEFDFGVYYIKAISPASSPVWSVANIRFFYGSDIVVQLILLIAPLILFFRNSYFVSRFDYFYLWFFLAALFTLTGNLISGILTSSGVYHLLNWLYIPHFIMFAIVFVLTDLAFMLGFFFIPHFLSIYGPVDNDVDAFKNLSRILNSILIPVCIALLILYAPFIHKLTAFDIFKISSVVIVPGSWLVFFRRGIPSY